MDPNIGRGTADEITEADIRVLEVIGYTVDYDPPTATVALSVDGPGHRRPVPDRGPDQPGRRGDGGHRRDPGRDREHRRGDAALVPGRGRALGHLPHQRLADVGRLAGVGHGRPGRLDDGPAPGRRPRPAGHRDRRAPADLERRRPGRDRDPDHVHRRRGAAPRAHPGRHPERARGPRPGRDPDVRAPDLERGHVRPVVPGPGDARDALVRVPRDVGPAPGPGVRGHLRRGQPAGRLRLQPEADPGPLAGPDDGPGGAARATRPRRPPSSATPAGRRATPTTRSASCSRRRST